jgi:hypothetical protein
MADIEPYTSTTKFHKPYAVMFGLLLLVLVLGILLIVQAFDNDAKICYSTYGNTFCLTNPELKCLPVTARSQVSLDNVSPLVVTEEAEAELKAVGAGQAVWTANGFEGPEKYLSTKKVLKVLDVLVSSQDVAPNNDDLIYLIRKEAGKYIAEGGEAKNVILDYANLEAISNERAFFAGGKEFIRESGYRVLTSC